MTQLLLRLFVRDHQNTQSPKVRAAVGRLSGLVGIGCNLLLSCLKLAVGTLSGSVAITADALNNLSDAVSAIVTLVGFRLAEKPADAQHPYGYARYEYLSGLAVAAMIVIIGFELARTSVMKILHPAPVAFSPALAAVLIGSILVKLWLMAFNRRLGRHIGSTALLAVAADSRNDVITTAAVLLEAILEAVTHWHTDGYMGLGVALFILWSGAELAKQTISPLLGEAASPELRQEIVDIVSACPHVLSYHDLMVHDYGPGQRFASIHVEMDRREDPLQCHHWIDEMERRCLRDRNIHLVIHYDPVDTGDERQELLRRQTETLLREIDDRLTVHDFRLGPDGLSFDVAVPPELLSHEDDIRGRLEAALGEQGRRPLFITFDPRERD